MTRDWLDALSRHDHPSQRDPRSHGGSHHELRCVDLNSAERREIEKLPMVGPKRAEALIAARPFRSWEDVAKVKGMNAGMIDDLKSGGAELG